LENTAESEWEYFFLLFVLKVQRKEKQRHSKATEETLPFTTKVM